MWPNNNTKLSSGYFEEIWSDKFGVIESLLSIAEVKMWCKLNNAKLLLISAFSPNFNRDYFFNTLIGDGKENKNYLYKNKDYTNLLLNSNIDWDNFDERKMDTVMFKVMNSYIDFIHPGDSIVWSPVVQSEILTVNYNLIKSNPRNLYKSKICFAIFSS